MNDFKKVAAAALACADTLVPQWLPEGKRSGNEWVALNPTRGDARAGSFSVNLATGVWSDFATQDAGGDLIDLYAYLHGMGKLDACRALGEIVSISAEPTRQSAARAKPVGGEVPAASAPKSRSNWQPARFAPDDAPAPPLAHPVRGVAAAVWDYLAPSGQIYGRVYRFVTSDGGKETLPLCWATNSVTGQSGWRWLAFGLPRALYWPQRVFAENAPLRAEPRPVLIVEGEKCADAAWHALGTHYDIATWPGGSKAVDKADWSPLAGRRVVIWPDCDAQTDKSGAIKPASQQPGTQAAERIAELLAAQGCTVRIVQIPEPGSKPGGWDVADAVAEGLTGDALLAFVRTQRAPACVNAPAQSGSANQATPTSQDAARAKPHGGQKPGSDWAAQLLMGKEGPRDCRENVIYVLRDHPEWQGALAIDTFAKRLVLRRSTPLGHRAGDVWAQDDESALGLWLIEQAGFSVRSLDTLAQGVRHTASLAEFHPVRDYFDGLVWDGKPRVPSWVVRLMGADDTPYHRQVGLFFLLNMVRRIYEPGCVMRSVPVFEGAQNKGKSRALFTLTNPWYADTMLRIGDKDAYQLIQGVMCYEVSEMDSFTRSEATAVKAFISSTEDMFRAPYERSPVKHLRQTSFAATTNAVEYLKDWTGNTRFWPIAVGQRIDLDGIAAERDQLWAEAIALYRAGERAYPTPDDERALFKPEQDARLIVHPWVEMIEEWLFNRFGSVSVREVMHDCLKIDLSRINPQGHEAQRVGQILQSLGYVKFRAGGRESRVWAWRKPEQQEDTEVSI